MHDIIKIMKSLKDSNVLIDGITETVKHEIARFLDALLALLAASLMQPVMSSVVKGISGRGIKRAGRVYIDKKILISLHPLSNIKI